MKTQKQETPDFDKKSQQIINQWFTIRSLSRSTQKTYIIYFKQFLQYNKTTPYKIYKKGYKEQKTQTPLQNRTLTQQILNYKYYIDNQDYTDATKYLKIKTIYSFCRAFKLETPDIRIKRPVCENKNYEKPLTKKELLLLLNTSPLREKAFLSIQATSGMSSKEVRTLTIQDIITTINRECDTHYNTINEILQNKQHILSHKIFEFNIVRKKVNYRYITYITDEAMENVLTYIQYRQNHDKKEIQPHNNIGTPIFVTNKGTPMTQKTVTAMYRIMGERVGFKTTPNTFRFWRSHNIRKYFYNLAEDIVGQEYADEWLGHVPSTVTRAYARREHRMREAYLKCYPYLTLNYNESNKDNNIKQKIKLLENEIEKLKQETN